MSKHLERCDEDASVLVCRCWRQRLLGRSRMNRVHAPLDPADLKEYVIRNAVQLMLTELFQAHLQITSVNCVLSYSSSKGGVAWNC